MAIICTCLPAIQIMIMALGAHFFGWNNSMTTRYGGSSGYGQSYGTASKLAKSHRSVKSASTSTTTMLNHGGGNGDFIRLNDIEAGINRSKRQLPGVGESEKTLAGKHIHVTRQIVVSTYEAGKI